MDSSHPDGGSSDTRLLLLGTQGGPNFTLARGETASALLVDGHAYLVDCGYGTLGSLIRAGADYRGIAQVFLTHLHDDHTADLPAFLVRQWTNGRLEPTLVIGPYGTRRLVEAILAVAEANTEIRFADEDRHTHPASLLSGIDIEATAAPVDVWRDDRIAVRSVENTHYPPQSRARMPHRSLAYRFDTRDRSIVFSGDTAYSAALVELARRADVLVCEAIEVTTMRQAFDTMVANGMYADNPEGIWQHIVDTHTPVEDAGRMAAEAGVGTLVLNHLVPGALGDLPDTSYVERASQTFGGTVIVGRDRMVI